MSEQPFDSQNAAYAQLLYEEYARNPESVPEAWRRFFDRGPEATTAAGLLVPEGLSANGRPAATETRPAPVVPPEAPGTDRGLLSTVARATSFVQAFRDHGHMLARIDPLGSDPPGHPQLDPSFFGTSMEELEEIPAEVVMGEDARADSVADALRHLREVYAGDIGYEFEHLEDPERVRWLWDQVESGVHSAGMGAEAKRALLDRLTEVEGFEQFLHRAFLGQKRFSIEGTDMLVPVLDLALEAAERDGGEEVVIGMAHRGRLNVLTHIVGIGYEEILREFEGVGAKGVLAVPGTGDVKYHHGAEGEATVEGGGTIRVTLAPNPSHLEFVNPVVLGMTRANQFGEEVEDARQDVSKVIPILIHGDAAFAAEGVVAETLNLARLDGYAVGGTIHVIVNNQIGFTTTPSQGRSTRYASDLAKGYDVPILHVNADRPEACLTAVRLAMAYRAEYGDDVVIDLVGYRRHGHNEGDEPAFTQPRLYEKIDGHPTVRTLWADRLVEEGVVTREEADAMSDRVADTLRDAKDRVEEEDPAEEKEAETSEQEIPDETGVGLETLREIDETALSWPDSFSVHPKLKRSLEKRRESFAPDTRIEWAHAETLAFGSILREGFVVRLTGQDSQRGTFSQRHLVLHDVETGETYTPLSEVGDGRLEVYNSPLTEAAVVGYEYGYSVAAKRDLILWEGQFGDFVNAAQVAIDQFVSSGKAKWHQQANLTLLLPHGYEGQGPEHSSARLERFLQLCAEENMRVVYPTTPAQYFHLLRRQAHARPERPLVVMTPKSLLRLPAASSEIERLTRGTFQPVIDDPGMDDEKRGGITRLVICSGKLYYDIQGSDRRDEATGVAVARLEELYPFPDEALGEVIGRYPKLEEVVWAQEEPRNMGSLTFVGPRLRPVVPRDLPLRYVARPERASPAEGKNADHRKEQARIVRDALDLPEEDADGKGGSANGSETADEGEGGA